MKSKKIIGIIGSLMMFLGMSVNVLAYSGNNDLNVVEKIAFQDLVSEIVEVKEKHQDCTEEELLNIVTEEMSLKLHIKKGVDDIWNALTNSEKKLVIRYPFDALKVNDAKNIATAQTEIKFGYNGLGNRSDAFRHGMWNAEMAILIGMWKAELFATAHEDKDTAGTETDGYLKIEHKSMDLHNNEIGREIGNTNLNVSENELSNIVYANIYQENSDFIWLHE